MSELKNMKQKAVKRKKSTSGKIPKPQLRAKKEKIDEKASATYPSKTRAKHMLAGEREAHIIRRAIEYFAVHGFGASTRDLAKHIDVTQPLIYHYFGNKKQLIERIYQEVFFRRWNPLWEIGLADVSRPIEVRLEEYLEDYTTAILRDDWIRLFIFAALEDPALNQQYIGILKDKIFVPVLSELRQSHGLDPAPKEVDIELFWSFHSSFFYIGMRRWIYRMKTPDNLSDIIKIHVRHFLDGYNAFLDREKTS